MSRWCPTPSPCPMHFLNGRKVSRRGLNRNSFRSLSATCWLEEPWVHTVTHWPAHQGLDTHGISKVLITLIRSVISTCPAEFQRVW